MQTNRMHVSMAPSVAIVLDDIFMVGQTYEIRNFIVSDFISRYKCVEGDSHIIFTNMTIANRLLPVDSLRL